MEACAYNGTCASCTHGSLQYAETEENLICCVANTDSIPGWISFIAKVPSECRPSLQVSTGIIVPVVLFFVLAIAGILWFSIRRFNRGNYTHVRSRVRPVFDRYDEYSERLPARVDWDEVELDAVVASLEATTAL